MLKDAYHAGADAAATKLGFDAEHALALAKAFGVGAVPGAVAGLYGSEEGRGLQGALLGGALGGLGTAGGLHAGTAYGKSRHGKTLDAPHPSARRDKALKYTKQRLEDSAAQRGKPPLPYEERARNTMDAATRLKYDNEMQALQAAQIGLENSQMAGTATGALAGTGAALAGSSLLKEAIAMPAAGPGLLQRAGGAAKTLGRKAAIATGVLGVGALGARMLGREYQEKAPLVYAPMSGMV